MEQSNDHLNWFIQNQNQYFNETLKVKHMVYIKWLAKSLNHAPLPVANTPIFEWNNPVIGYMVFKMFKYSVIFVGSIIINVSLNSA